MKYSCSNLRRALDQHLQNTWCRPMTTPSPSCTAVHLQPEFEEGGVIPLDVMPLNGVGQTFTILNRAPGSLALGKMAAILKFRVKEVDPSTGETSNSPRAKPGYLVCSCSGRLYRGGGSPQPSGARPGALAPAVGCLSTCYSTGCRHE
jgi:hypothetical protein